MVSVRRRPCYAARRANGIATNMLHRTPALRRLALACTFAVAASLQGCATVTGVVTGAFTGFVDLPSEIVRTQDMKTDAASTWGIVILAAPVGFGLGPLFAFVKGVALDVSAASGTLTLHDEFGTYGRASVWRPFSYDWQPKR